MTKTGQLFCAWCGPACAVLCAIGLLPLAHFVPPPSPSDSAVAIVARYHDHATGIRAGMFCCAAGFTLAAAFGAGIAARTFSKEPRYPALAFTQVTMIGVSLFVGVLFALVASLATFRAGDIDPQITLTLNDATWFIFLIWAPFMVWLVALGLSILLDRSGAPPFPRWLGYLSIWVGLLGVPAGLIPFFKTGPFAYNGLFAWYVPAFVFFLWLAAMTVEYFRAIRADA